MTDELRDALKLRWGVNFISLLAICTALSFPVILLTAWAGVTGFTLDQILIASQILCALTACASMVAAAYTYKRMVLVMEKKEVESRLSAVKQLRQVKWQPGEVLWIQTDRASSKTLKTVKKMFREHYDADDLPILVTDEDTTINSLSVVDMLALIGRASLDQTEVADGS